MIIDKVYLDMDGVLVNFRKGIHKAFNKPYVYSTLSKKWKFWEDWPEITFKMVNAVCDTLFWRHLEWMHDGHDIFEAVFGKFKTNQIYLLTTPMPNLESASGKMMWVNDNLPTYLKRTIITQAPKHLLAEPGTLLIDDKNQNIDGFIKAGGQGILVPRSWNRDYGMAHRTVEVVKDNLEILI